MMTELEKNPEALRRGAVAVACAAVAVTAMPAISHRAAEQRADAQWAARAASFQKIVVAAMEDEANASRSSKPEFAHIPLELASYNPDNGYRARGSIPVARDWDGAHSLAVNAGLRDQAGLQGLAPFQPARLGAARRAAKEQRCLSEAIYYEARGESYAGQSAVAEVVLNRVRSAHYPDTICDVVYQGSWRSTGCQFTFTCDGSLGHRPRGEAWRRASLVAKQAMMGISKPLTQRATHYHTTEVSPYWSASLIETTRVGAHIFYRMPSRRERVLTYSAPDRSPSLSDPAPLLDPGLDLEQAEAQAVVSAEDIAAAPSLPEVAVS